MNPKKILIVDDNAVLVKGLSNVLSGAGYQVLQAEDGAGAVSTVRRDRPNLVLLDIRFPPDVAHGGGVPWDGFLIMSWLSRMEETKNIPIVIISGCEAEKYKPMAMKAGAVAYVQKPFEPEELLVTVRQILGDPAPQPELAGPGTVS
jgi:CheY-like chemotaxis protein